MFICISIYEQFLLRLILISCKFDDILVILFILFRWKMKFLCVCNFLPVRFFTFVSRYFQVNPIGNVNGNMEGFFLQLFLAMLLIKLQILFKFSKLYFSKMFLVEKLYVSEILVFEVKNSLDLTRPPRKRYYFASNDVADLKRHNFNELNNKIN